MEKTKANLYFIILGVLVFLSSLIMLGMANSDNYIREQSYNNLQPLNQQSRSTPIPQTTEASKPESMQHYEEMRDEANKQTEEHITEMNNKDVPETIVDEAKVSPNLGILPIFREDGSIGFFWLFLLMITPYLAFKQRLPNHSDFLFLIGITIVIQLFFSNISGTTKMMIAIATGYISSNRYRWF